MRKNALRRALLFAICIGLFANILFSLAPAFFTSRTDVNSILKDQTSFNPASSGFQFRRVLVTAEIALSVILLIAAGLFVRTILRFQSADLGYNRNILLLKSDSLGWGPDVSQAVDFYRRSLDQIRELPGVISAAWAEDLPLNSGHLEEEVSRDPEDLAGNKWTEFGCNSITTGYFKTVGIPILQGRDFTEQDIRNAPGVVIVNESLARKFWPGTIPLGKRIRLRGHAMDVESVPARSYEVVGVAKDVRYHSPNGGPEPYVYFYHEQFVTYFHLDLHVKTTGNPLAQIEPIRKACAKVSSKFAILDPRMMGEQLDLYLSEERAAAFIFGIFGPLALILAAIGLYGIISYSVTQRMYEFGIRMALGAQQKNILSLVLRDGMVSAVVGLAIGLPASMALSRLITARLHGLSPIDPITYTAISVLCILVSIAAILLPARKAYSIPWDLLRKQ